MEGVAAVERATIIPFPTVPETPPPDSFSDGMTPSGPRSRPAAALRAGLVESPPRGILAWVLRILLAIPECFPMLWKIAM
jgi:hypothetical protein